MTERQLKNGNIIYDDVEVIAQSAEKYITFKIDNLIFIDSFQFLSSSLDSLVETMLKGGRDGFKHTTAYFKNSTSVYQKGVFPYSYINCDERLNETCLPPIEAFFNDLSEEPCSPENYQRALDTWSEFHMTDMRQYQNHYLTTDTLLLADVFDNFRQEIYADHGLEALCFYTLPGLAWAAALKFTGVKLQLLTDLDMYLFFESGVRGGVSSCSVRRAKSNNPKSEEWDSTERSSYLQYYDMNNLYGAAMSEYLPIGQFEWLSPRQISQLDYLSIPEKVILASYWT